METKEGVDEKLPIGILSLQNYTQKMMEDSSEIRAFIIRNLKNYHKKSHQRWKIHFGDVYMQSQKI